MGKTSVNRYKGSTLTRVPTLLLAVTKDLAFFSLVTNRKVARVLCRIYRFWETSRVGEGGSGGMLPREIFLK